MSELPVLLEKDANGVATLTLNRPHVHNAFDDALIECLGDHLTAIAADDAVRVVVLASTGKNFSAGADLNWMRRMAGYSEAENLKDSLTLARVLRQLYDLPRPTIGLIQGSAYGGGVGLVACCDIAVTVSEASFALTEVRLGLIPSVISPFVIAAIGARQASRYFLTGEPMDADTAARLGLVHEVVMADALASVGARYIKALLACGPAAEGEAKALIRAVANRPIDEAVGRDTAARIARVRASDDGKEGLNAFLEKRKPAWREGS